MRNGQNCAAQLEDKSSWHGIMACGDDSTRQYFLYVSFDMV
jgi:hypothetical protein